MFLYTINDIWSALFSSTIHNLQYRDNIATNNTNNEDEDDMKKITIRGMILIIMCKGHLCALGVTVYMNNGLQCYISHVGPGLGGDESFDMECVFGNKVDMTYIQVKQLRRLVEVTPRPKIKEYVCQIMTTNVLPDCKMVSFSYNILDVIGTTICRMLV